MSVSCTILTASSLRFVCGLFSYFFFFLSDTFSRIKQSIRLDIDPRKRTFQIDRDFFLLSILFFFSSWIQAGYFQAIDLYIYIHID